ncbi:MAG TPA: hypothetical protein DDX91_01225 [Ruminococcaceae bacterium]|nr:hypothetical protein [Oscillospiraceae bacterium]
MLSSFPSDGLAFAFKLAFALSLLFFALAFSRYLFFCTCFCLFCLFCLIFYLSQRLPKSAFCCGKERRAFRPLRAA